jgi:hypothetical protein
MEYRGMKGRKRNDEKDVGYIEISNRIENFNYIRLKLKC